MAAVGDIFEAPWGRYVVHHVNESRVILRSLERVAAVIRKVLPDADYQATGEVVGSDTVPRRADPENGLIRGGVGRPGRLEATNGGEVTEAREVPPLASEASACGASHKTVDALDLGKAVARAMSMPIASPDRPTLGGIRPGCARGGWGPTWVPCLTRARNDNDQPSSSEHCWFLAGVNDSLYCEACRIGKPLVVVGEAAAIAEIRSALERGDRARVAELVQVRSGGGGSSSFSRPLASPDPAIPSGGPSLSDLGCVSASSESDAPAEAMVLPSGSCGNGGSPTAVEPQSVHPAPVSTGEIEGVPSTPDVATPPPAREYVSAKDETADFSWRPRPFQPRDLDDWKEFAAERAAIRQYECWPTKEEAERPGRREEAERFARALAGPPPRSRAA